MRIMLFAAGGDIGGGKTHILSLASELSKHNQLRLVSFRKGILSDEAQQMGLDVAVIDASKGMLAAFIFALKQTEEFKPEIIHCHGSKANLLGVLVKFIKHITVITTVHSDPKLDYMGSFVRRITYGNLNAFALRHMDFYVAVAGGMRNLLIKRGFGAQKIYTIYNGLDFTGCKDQAREYAENPETITVGIAARFNPVKDLPTLLKAFAKAYGQNNKLRLSLAGSGECEQQLKQLAAELGIAEVTEFAGWQSDTKKYFEKIDINVLSSLSETFPYSLLEGAYTHCPAIASNVGGIPYLIQNEKTGLLFNAGDVDALAANILRLAEDRKLASELAENLYTKAREEFSLAHMQQTQQSIYESVAAIAAKKGQRYGAVVCGAYGKGNSGDEAILRALRKELQSIDKNLPIYVMSRKPVETQLAEGVASFHIFNIFKFAKALRKSKLFISGGGTLIQNATSNRSLAFYLYAIRKAKKKGCKVMMYGCGVGPVSGKFPQKNTKKVINKYVDVITLRDSMSKDFLRELGICTPKISLAADPTVSIGGIEKEDALRLLAKEGIPVDAPKIAFALRRWEDFETNNAVTKAAEYAYTKYGLNAVFIPMEYPKDLAVSEAACNMVQTPAYVLKNAHSAEELMSVVGCMDMVCGMRLHSLMFASAAGLPFIGISYDVKVEGFVKDAGGKLCIPLEKLTAEKLISAIDKAAALSKASNTFVQTKLIAAEKINVKWAEKLLK